MGYIELSKLMLALIKRLGSQNALAKALRQNRQQIHRWLTGENKPKYELVSAMQKLLKNLIEAEAQKNTATKNLALLDAQAFGATIRDNSIVSLTLSQQVELAQRFEAEAGNRQGFRSDRLETVNKNSLFYQSVDQPRLSIDKVDQHFDLKESEKNPFQEKFKGRTDELAAKQVGLGKDTYRNAKKVLSNGVPALIKAMDSKVIGISTAATIARLPQEKQTELLAMDVKAMLTTLKNFNDETSAIETHDQKQKHTAGLIRIIDVMKIQHSQELIEIEEAEGLPARAMFIGLIAECDGNGRFFWEPVQLKEKILSYVDFDVQALMELLRVHGFIKKTRCRAQVYGVIALRQFMPPTLTSIRKRKGQEKHSLRNRWGKRAKALKQHA